MGEPACHQVSQINTLRDVSCSNGKHPTLCIMRIVFEDGRMMNHIGKKRALYDFAVDFYM
jgi:hypothetical protein